MPYYNRPANKRIPPVRSPENHKVKGAKQAHYLQAYYPNAKRPEIQAAQSKSQGKIKKKEKRGKKVFGGLILGAVSGIVLDMLLIMTMLGQIRKDIYIIVIIAWILIGVCDAGSKLKLRGAVKGILFAFLFVIPVGIYMYFTDAAMGFFILNALWATVWATLVGIILE